jgi:ABC-type lipoprotein release transport system permease subunit
MNTLTLVRRGLRFYRRTHLGVIAGCAVSAAVLVGALFVGDSVRGSLARIAMARLGRIHHALDTGNRYFRDDLAARVQAGLRADTAAALRVQGMALREDGKKQVNHVEVLGVDRRFLEMGESLSPVKLGPGQVVINAKLAAALGAKAGDEVALRLFKPGLLSREAPLASRTEKDTQRSLLSVVAVLSDDQMGRFSLKADQIGPHNAFVDLAWLQDTLDLPHKANLIVTGATSGDPREWLRSAWVFEDLGVAIRSPESSGVVQVQSERIYLETAVSTPALKLQRDAAGVLYYLVNSISVQGGRSTPYSFMAAISPTADRKLGPIPADMKDDEIIVNRWLADHLSVRAGDRVEVAYPEVTTGSDFVEKRREFRVRGVVEMNAVAKEKDLVPEFPGLTDVESCKDWKMVTPMDEKQLKDEANEAYWKEHRQTPKAFVTLAAGRAMWGNRYGDLMAVRYLSSATNAGEVRDMLREHVDPEQTGFVFRPVRDQALQAAGDSMDLGQLFLGMSLFLIAASLVLTAMFFVFSVEQRAKEMGVLFAVGFPPGKVRTLFLSEGAVLAVLGSFAGIPLGWGFAKFLVWGLGSAWSGAVAGAAIDFHARADRAALGAGAAAVISLLAMAVALWRQSKRPLRELVAEDFSVSLENPGAGKGSGRVRRTLFLACTALAIAVAVGTLASGAANPAGAFFGAGALMLIGGIARVRMSLARMSAGSSAKLSAGELGVRNAGRRPGRSLATAGMVACGCFVVFSVSAMKEDYSRQGGEKKSGTGGFRLYAETSIAIPHDLNDARGRAAYRLTDKDQLSGVSFLPIRVREGDDASCLNLNLSLTPPLMGVDAAKLGARGSFAGPEIWGLLEAPHPDDVVPALVGDSATAMWKLKKSVGKDDGALLDYRDERGKPFQVKLVGQLPSRLSVLQGRLLISDRDFTRLFPSEGGYRAFLGDVPAGSEERVMKYFSEKMETAGFDVVSSVERLKEFYVVESSYLGMFLALGGMGLLLGSAGMGILVLRHVMERRNELALLRAVGYTQSDAAGVVMAEHRFVLWAGLLTGTIASALAVGPSALRPEIHVPYLLLAGFLVGTAALSLGWIWIATRLALRAPLVPALRHE